MTAIRKRTGSLNVKKHVIDVYEFDWQSIRKHANVQVDAHHGELTLGRSKIGRFEPLSHVLKTSSKMAFQLYVWLHLAIQKWAVLPVLALGRVLSIFTIRSSGQFSGHSELCQILQS